MIAEAKRVPRPLDLLLIWKSNRLSRNVEHRLGYQRILCKKGIRIISMHEPEFEGSMAVIMEPILATVDEFYCAQIAEDTLRGLKQIARDGYSAGGQPPRGYRNAKKAVGIKKDGQPIFRTAWKPDPEWKDRALLAFRMAAEGKIFDDICPATGVMSNKSSLSTYLRNRAFIG
jgi:DNA invertase Pin-like site-specific DNA recombinase